MAGGNGAACSLLSEPVGQAIVMVFARVVVAHRGQIDQAGKIPLNFRQRAIHQVSASCFDLCVLQFAVHELSLARRSVVLRLGAVHQFRYDLTAGGAETVRYFLQMSDPLQGILNQPCCMWRTTDPDDHMQSAGSYMKEEELECQP